jgi:hypothetical protein
MASWLRDLLLESPIPPSNWMPARSERIANARATLRRRFGQAQDAPPPRAHRLRDLGGAYPLAGGTRYVSGESIEADLEADITSVNPPVVQGWAYLAAIGAAWLFLLGLGTSRQDPLRGLLEMAGAPVAWLALQAAWGFGQRMLELQEDGVHVRRWTDVWLRRPGQRLGAPGAVRARLYASSAVELIGADATVRIPLRTWSSTARADLVDEVPEWGVDCSFGRRRQARAHH